MLGVFKNYNSFGKDTDIDTWPNRLDLLHPRHTCQARSRGSLRLARQQVHLEVGKQVKQVLELVTLSLFFPDLPIPPRPPPEDIPPVSPTDPTTAKSRSGRGSAPPPPPAPYSKRPSAAKVRNGVHVFLDTCLLAFVQIKKNITCKVHNS